LGSESGLRNGARVLLNVNGVVGELLSYLWVDVVVDQRLFELLDTVLNLSAGCIDSCNGCVFEFLRLLILKFKLTLLTLLLVRHILLPILNTLLKPLFHETGVSLQLVDLSTSDLLLFLLLLGFLSVVEGLSFVGLAISLVLELLQVTLHVGLLLRLVECLQAHFEEGRLHLVVGLLLGANLHGGLRVPVLAGLSKNGDVGWRVNLLEDHLELVQQSQGVATLLLHDLVDTLRVELDLQIP